MKKSLQLLIILALQSFAISTLRAEPKITVMQAESGKENFPLPGVVQANVENRGKSRPVWEMDSTLTPEEVEKNWRPVALNVHSLKITKKDKTMFSFWLHHAKGEISLSPYAPNPTSGFDVFVKFPGNKKLAHFSVRKGYSLSCVFSAVIKPYDKNVRFIIVTVNDSNKTVR